MLQPRRIAFAMLGLALALAPASAGGAKGVTTRSTPFDRPPYFRGDLPPADACVALLPVAATLPDDVPASWFPRSALEALGADVERYLRQEFPGGALLSAPGGLPAEGVPTVNFSCTLDGLGECDAEVRQNELVVAGRSRKWRDRATAVLAAGEPDFVLQVEVGLAPRWIHQKNLSGKKEVRLGSDRAQALPWLTSLDSPVWVLQLSGAVIDREGKVVRAGSEGLWAVRTPFRASMVGAERLMTADEVEALRTSARREDLPGAPLVWQAAAHRLVHGLLRGTDPGSR